MTTPSTCTEDTPTMIDPADLLANDSDIDGDSLVGHRRLERHGRQRRSSTRAASPSRPTPTCAATAPVPSTTTSATATAAATAPASPSTSPAPTTTPTAGDDSARRDRGHCRRTIDLRPPDRERQRHRRRHTVGHRRLEPSHGRQRRSSTAGVVTFTPTADLCGDRRFIRLRHQRRQRWQRQRQRDGRPHLHQRRAGGRRRHGQRRDRPPANRLRRPCQRHGRGTRHA